MKKKKKKKKKDIDECSTNYGECHDQATCINTPGSFTCACKSGYSGNGVTCDGIFFYSFPFMTS